ncbi:MAG: rRNA maturation RNase YbeY [Clostridiales Family XIII bacterium]|nr:rRNA maturation RNase YbeY [Clostridiales Family XIII bacterium]
MRRAAEAVCASRGIEQTEISLSFASPAEIRDLNSRYRGVDEVTDVLSFPQLEADEFQGTADGYAPVLDDMYFTTCTARSLKKARADRDAQRTLRTIEMLGDIVICTERAREQAAEYGHSEQRELVYLFVHGMLHLLGYDHEDETKRAEMREAEEAVMNEVGLTRER